MSTMQPERANGGGGPRVLLVKPHQNRDTGQTGHPLGLMYLSAWLKQNGYENVRIVDMMVERMPYSRLADIFRDWRPELVGIGGLNWESRHVHRVAAVARETVPGALVVTGGPYPSAYWRQVLEDTNVDVVAIGEGENILLELVRRLEAGHSPRGVRGTAWRENGEVAQAEPMPFLEALDELPNPDWDAVPIRRYRKFHRFSRTGRGDYMSLFTSRACPFHCNYCHNIFGKTFRKRSPDRVLAEIETLVHDYGIREFEIFDDIFNFDVKRAKEICRRIVEADLGIRFTLPNGIRGDMMDEELIELLARAGCVFISWAVETASPRLQKEIRKHNNLEKLRRSIEGAVARGIYSHGFFMLGFPTETREELQLTVDFLLRSPLHSASVFTVNPFEGTRLAEQARELGKPVGLDAETNYFSDRIANLTELPTSELLQLRRQALRRFYLNPRRLARLVRDFPTRANLVDAVAVRAFARRMIGGY